MQILKKTIIILILSLNLCLAAKNTTGLIFINPNEPLIKKSILPSSIRSFIEKKLDLTLDDNDILTEISVCSCNCHDFKKISCPAFPKYVPLSIFIDKNKDGSFKLNTHGSLQFKTENAKILLNLKERTETVKATLCLKQLIGKNQKLEHTLQQMYQVFKKQNLTYAELFEQKKKPKVLLAKLNSISEIYKKTEFK